jgi:hypothetical protein
VGGWLVKPSPPKNSSKKFQLMKLYSNHEAPIEEYKMQFRPLLPKYESTCEPLGNLKEHCKRKCRLKGHLHLHIIYVY